MAEENKAIILPSLQHPDRKQTIVDFQNEQYANNTDNISTDSSVDYSIAYIYHLCKVNELLAPILLMQHNMEQMENFMLLLRSVKDSPEKLNTVLELV